MRPIRERWMRKNCGTIWIAVSIGSVLVFSLLTMKNCRKLGRIHTWEEFLDSFHQARIAGFTNINVDLMSALPGQTVDSWRKTLEKVLELKPEHISAYSLIIEEGTPFYEKYEDHPELLPPEEEERQMYHDTKKILS